MEPIVNHSPLVSIVLPTYNRAKMLQRAVASIIAQQYNKWELIVVDNNSTDDTASVIATFNDERIKLLTIQNEGSIGKSRNHAIRHASGEWIAFIDSDDWWLPNKLSVCVAYCSDKVDFIYHDLLISDNGDLKKRKVLRGWDLKQPVINDLMVRGNAIANSSAMVRRTLFDKIGLISEDMNVNPCVDYNTWLKIANYSDAFKYLPKTLGGYLVHPGGVSRRDMSKSLEFAISEFTDRLTTSELNCVQRNISYVHGRYLYLKNDYTPAQRALVRSLNCKNLKVSLRAFTMLIFIRICVLLNHQRQ